MLSRGSRLVFTFAIGLVATSTAQAQFLPTCVRCQSHAIPRPVAPVVPIVRPMVPMTPACGCQTPIVQQQLRPVVETQMRQQQVMTYQDVVKTQIRREQQVVSVPVTTTRQVTVDQGGYKMVWVPNLVTKNVTETTVQQQVQVRDVPVQVVERIPQVQTQLVPQRVVRYVPETRVVYGYGPGAVAYAPVIPSATPLAVQPIPQAASTNTALAPIPDPVSTPQTTPQTSAPQVITPQASQSAEEWKTIPQRQAASETIQQQSYAQQGEQVIAPTEPQRLFAPGVPTAVRAFPGIVR
ncbi:MAG: hypothetical protein KDA58_16245 [Planctomycetaceae bacterium]|nr:hypothetical protein [Planctomycetaceae bacterium]